MKLKVGVLTFHRCINYGSFWQALSLAECLKSRGHDVSILDHHSARINLQEWRCAYQPVLPTPVPASDYKLYRKKTEGFFRAFEALPLSAPFPVTNPALMDAQDLVVVGSDEVWNIFHPWYGRHLLFYGEGLNAPRLISYAASFGNYPAAWGLEKEYATRLFNFDEISVRDENSRQLVEDATGMMPQLVLDPCLQFPLTPEYRCLHELPSKYLAVYGHNFSESFIREVRKVSRDLNLRTISIGYRNDWADQQWITADPHEFSHFIANAQAVATNFFHGCVFALRYNRPFVCETSAYRNIKVKGLMSKLKGARHLTNAESTEDVYRQVLSRPVDESIVQRITTLRQQSDDFLNRALILKTDTRHGSAA